MVSCLLESAVLVFWCTNTIFKNPVFPCALFVDTAANFMRREAPLRSNPCTEPTLLQVFCLMLRDPAGVRRGAYPAFPNCRPQSLHQRSCLLPTAAWIADAGHPLSASLLGRGTANTRLRLTAARCDDTMHIHNTTVNRSRKVQSKNPQNVLYGQTGQPKAEMRRAAGGRPP